MCHLRFLLAAIVAPAAIIAQPRSPAIRDSAGVQIVQLTIPTNPHRWTLSPQPTVRIKGEVDTGLVFGHVLGSHRFRNGNLIVEAQVPDANQPGAGEMLLVFDSRGNFIRRIGRFGRGPGEYAYGLMAMIAMPGDSVLVVDRMNEVFVTHVASRLFDRHITFEGFQSGRSFGVVGRFADGSLALWKQAPPSDSVPYRNNTYYRYTPDGRRINLIAAEQFVSTGDRSGPSIWRRTGWGYVGDSTFYVFDTDVFGYREFGKDGRLLRTVRTDRPPRHLTVAEMDAYKRYLMREPPSSRSPGFDPDRLRFPDHVRAIERVVTDAAGNLWIADGRATPDEPGTWHVFDKAHRHLAVLSTPPNFGIVEIGRDYVLGIWMGEEGEIEAQLYGLKK